MEINKTIDSYLSMNFSNKYYYIVNNPDIDDEKPSLDALYHQIKQDLGVVFRVLKISPNKNGYSYWFDAVFLNIITEKPHISICKDIYSVIAMKYATTSMAVERAMRLCFENTMYNLSKQDDNFVTSYFKNSLVYPHNSEILSKITELLISKEFHLRKYGL